jgi:hypothetical protein
MAKVLLSIDNDLLAQVDEVAASLNLSRSAYVSETLAKDAGERRRERLRASAEALEHIRQIAAQYPEPDDGLTITEWIRRERDSR